MFGKSRQGPKKILIIDDDQDVVDVYSARLVAMGFEVEGETDQIEARWKIRTYEPDLIVLDLVMPVMSGMDILTSLPRRRTGKLTPVIILTSYKDICKEDDVRVFGVVGVYEKGREDEPFFTCARQVLNGKLTPIADS